MEAKAEDGLTDKQRRYVSGVAKGLSSKEAARQAGFSETFAKVAGHRLSKHPAIKTELEKIRAAAREHAGYDLEAASAAVDKAIVFAYAKNSPLALSKLLEHKAKLYGLLIEKVDLKTTHIDLKGALEAAKARVLNITTSRHESFRAVELPDPISCSRGAFAE